MLSGQYNIPNIYAEVDAVYTNTAPVDAYRGAGRPEATFVVERLVEVAARELGRDPAEFRRANFITAFPHQTPVIVAYDTGNYGPTLDKALELADYKGIGARKAASAAKGKLRGIGFSAYIEACGLGPSQAIGSLGAGVGGWESAEVRVNMVGTVEVLTGSHSHGQGHETTFAQLVSGRLGIPIENVNIVHGDTDKVQMGMGTYGSRSGAVGMTAISRRSTRSRPRRRRSPAMSSRLPKTTSSSKDGKFTVKGTDKSIDFVSLSLAAYTAHKFPGSEVEPGLKESAFWEPTNFTFPAGVHVCELEIDPETGIVIDRSLDGGRRFRRVDQSDDRRRPGPWRHRAGRRAGAAGRRGLRRGRPIGHGELHGLLHAARRRFLPRSKSRRSPRPAPPIRSDRRAAAKPARSLLRPP